MATKNKKPANARKAPSGAKPAPKPALKPAAKPPAKSAGPVKAAAPAPAREKSPKMEKNSKKTALRDSILKRKAPSKPIAFSLDEVRAIAKTVSTKAS